MSVVELGPFLSPLIPHGDHNPAVAVLAGPKSQVMETAKYIRLGELYQSIDLLFDFRPTPKQ